IAGFDRQLYCLLVTQTKVGTRIVAYGATGAGKTTLARRIAAAKGLVAIEMDGIRHERGWDSTPWEEFADRVVAALDAASVGWVCEGNYSRIAPIPLARADTIIWLHLPWRVSFWRLLGRTISRAWTKELLYNSDGPRESWRLSFLSPNSILWWSIHHHRATNARVRSRL